MRYDITPTGLHYLLIHWDIPDVDASAWRLAIDGAVERPVSLSMDDLRARPAVTTAVTMECAGNGRAQFSPRPIGQPWLHEAIGTAEWTGTPLRDVLEEAGVRSNAVELVFTGADSGYQGDVLQDYQRSLSIADAWRPEVLLAYEDYLLINIANEWSGEDYFGGYSAAVEHLRENGLNHTLVIDANLGRVVSHNEPERGNKPELNDAQRILADEAARREAMFQESVNAEKTRGDALSRRFEEALKQAKQEPITRPARDFDLD